MRDATTTFVHEADAAKPDHRERVAKLRRALANGNFDEALSAAEDLLTDSNETKILERVFSQAQRPDLLAELMWRSRDLALCRLSSVGEYMTICARLRDGERRLSELMAWLLAAETPPVVFSYRDYLGRFKSDAARWRALFRIKYKGWEDASSLAERVTALALRCETPKGLIEMLQRDDESRASCDAQWAREVAVAQSFGHVFRDATVAGRLLAGESGGDAFLRGFQGSVNNGMLGLADAACWQSVFRGVDTSRGLVVCTAHNHFAKVTISLFKNLLPESFVMHLKEFSGRDGGSSQDGQRSASFRAFKVLTNAKAVLIASDGSLFSDQAAVDIRILGRPVRFSAGAAVLAYEAHSDTGWCHSIRKNGCFVPVYVPGPSRGPDESLARYRDRWIAFYAAQYEAALMSSPSDLALFLSSDPR